MKLNLDKKELFAYHDWLTKNYGENIAIQVIKWASKEKGKGENIDAEKIKIEAEKIKRNNLTDLYSEVKDNRKSLNVEYKPNSVLIYFIGLLCFLNFIGVNIWHLGQILLVWLHKATEGILAVWKIVF